MALCCIKPFALYLIWLLALKAECCATWVGNIALQLN